MQTQWLFKLLAVCVLTLFLLPRDMSFHDQTQALIVECVFCCISYSEIFIEKALGDTLFNCNFIFFRRG